MLENGMYTDNFLLWCRKIEPLRDDELTIGFNELERQKIAAAANAKKIFPPDYATFIGMCKARTHRVDPINDPSHPNYIEPKEVIMLEHEGTKEERKQTGRDSLKDMLKGDFSPSKSKRQIDREMRDNED